MKIKLFSKRVKVIIDSIVLPEPSGLIEEHLINLKKLKRMYLHRKIENKLDNRRLVNGECLELFDRTRHLSHLEKLYLYSNRERNKIGCTITSESCKMIDGNIKYLRNLKELQFGGKNENENNRQRNRR